MELNKPISGEERKKRYMNEKPSLFYDNSERDEAETLLDFYLSYTLRSSIENHPRINPMVNEYAKKVLFCLFGDDIEYNNNIQIKEVRTWKQWERIDLVAEVDLIIDEQAVSYAFIIENKLYTKNHHGQLDRYKESALNFYTNHKEKSHFRILYRFITCHEEVSPEDKEACEKAEFKHLTFQDLRDSLNSDSRTGDGLFDEFWFRYY